MSACLVFVGCALKIADGLPSQLCIQENSNVLARYASICQQVINKKRKQAIL